jgi:ATP-dependent DNA ligase
MNKTFPTLYSKDTNGNTRIWYMEQNGHLYRTHSGVKDGQIVISDFSTAESKNVGKKNETSASEQATAEIEAKYKKQLKTGYHENENDADLGTDYVEPMLAQTLHKLSKKPNYQKEVWGMQCKFNGNRCVATKHGLYSRKGEKYLSVPHIENALKSFFDAYPLAILDGELFNNDLRQQLNEISKLIRKTKNIDASDLAASEKLVKFYIYDGYNFTGKSDVLDEEVPYSERKNWIDKVVIPLSDYFVEVDTKIVKSDDHMNELFQTLLADQQEGGILRKMDSGYEHKRSKNLVKVKSEDDSEATILDITDGDGNWKGAATNVTLNWKDKTFDGVFKGNYARRAEILKNKKDWINKNVTFLYMGLTGLGTPNYARIDPDNCFKTDR